MDSVRAEGSFPSSRSQPKISLLNQRGTAQRRIASARSGLCAPSVDDLTEGLLFVVRRDRIRRFAHDPASFESP